MLAHAVVPEPLSVTAQSLIARDATDPMRVRRLTRLLLRLGCILAAGEQALGPASQLCCQHVMAHSFRILWLQSSCKAVVLAEYHGVVAQLTLIG